MHYFSTAPFLGGELIPGEDTVAYVSFRSGGGGWVTQSMGPAGARFGGVLGFEGDLSRALVESTGAELTPGAPLNQNSYYLRSLTGAYQFLLATSGDNGPTASEFSLAGFSADGSHLIFESDEALVAGAAQGAEVANLYELDLGSDRLSLVGVVPSSGESCSGAGCVTPAQGSYAGAGGGLAFLKETHGYGFYTQSAISADGGLVFFTALPSQRLYVRVGEAGTFAVSQGPARFLGATPSGEYVFYSEGGPLYRRQRGGTPGSVDAVPV